MVGKTYAIKVNIVIDKLLKSIKLMIVIIGRILLLKLSSILNLDNSPKRIFLNFIILSYYPTFKP